MKQLMSRFKSSMKAKTKTSNTNKVSKKAKNTIPKVNKTNKSWLDVPHENKFYSNDGKMLNNLSELPDALKMMDNSTFSHHVSKENNDFANWIDHVMGEKKLAEDLRQLKSKSGMVKSIQKLL